MSESRQQDPYPPDQRWARSEVAHILGRTESLRTGLAGLYPHSDTPEWIPGAEARLNSLLAVIAELKDYLEKCC